jgi:hypothetical protein
MVADIRSIANANARKRDQAINPSHSSVQEMSEVPFRIGQCFAPSRTKASAPQPMLCTLRRDVTSDLPSHALHSMPARIVHRAKYRTHTCSLDLTPPPTRCNGDQHRTQSLFNFTNVTLSGYVTASLICASARSQRGCDPDSELASWQPGSKWRHGVRESMETPTAPGIDETLMAGDP